MFTLPLDVACDECELRWADRLRPITGLPGEPVVLCALDVPGIARCALEPLDDRCDIDSRRIANEHLDLACVAACHQLRADLGGLANMPHSVESTASVLGLGKNLAASRKRQPGSAGLSACVLGV